MKHSIVIEEPNPLASSHVDEYGDDDETNTDYWVASDAVRAFVQPTGSNEDESDRETIVQTFDVYVPPSVAISGNARVRIIVEENVELICRVQGEPMLYHTATRGPSHRVAHVEAVSG